MHLGKCEREKHVKMTIRVEGGMLVNKINVGFICKLTALCLISNVKFPKPLDSLTFWIKLGLSCFNIFVMAAVVRIYLEHCDHWALLGFSVLSAVNLWMGWARTNPFVWESDIYTRFLFKKCWSSTSWPWYVSEAEMGLPLSTKSYSHISDCSVSGKVGKANRVCVARK